ncbi:MAG: redox-sensing transcriptional repressor Rex [Bacillota bacterium]
MSTKVPQPMLRRLPNYLMLLRKYKKNGVAFCSASRIAEDLGYTSIQVRKDLQAVSDNPGVPNQGRDVRQLIDDLESFLGYKDFSQAVLVGVGHLGSALLSYEGFRDYNMKIVLAFDTRAHTPEMQSGVPIYHTSKLRQLVTRLHIQIGIIVVPTEAAQGVCDALVDSGVKAIWNFAPVHLNVPSDVIVYNENMAESLAFLSSKLREKEEI